MLILIIDHIFISFFCCCSVTESCPTLCDPMNCTTPGFPVLHYLPDFAQTHIRWVSDASQSSHPLSAPSLLAIHLSQHQDLCQWVNSLHQVAQVSELRLQHQSSQWIFRADFMAALGLTCGMPYLHCNTQASLYLWCVWLHKLLPGMRYLSSLTKDRTHVPSIGRQILNRWSTREIPEHIF